MSEIGRAKTPLQKGSFGENDLLKIGIVKKDFHLYKLKMFSTDGEIVFSTDPGDIGRVNRNDYFHDIVAKGRTFTKTVRKNKKTWKAGS